MNIGQASQEAGITAKMVRYYESIGLLPEADRRSSGYRDYSANDISRLKFLRRARSLGFSVPQIHQLMALWSDRDRSNAEVRALALKHTTELEMKAQQLQEMIQTLRRLARACQRGNRPQCPIIEDLVGGSNPPTTRERLKKSRHRALTYAR